jgi:uncharacterized protein (TIGR03437 family)
VNCGPTTSPCNANSTVAPDSLVSAFGTGLATGQASAASSTYPTTLGGTSIALVDSSNTSFPVPLVFVSPGQVNYMVPSGAKTGPAWLTITSGNGAVSQGVVLVAAVAPGIYSANANGQGVASAEVVTVHADQSQTVTQTFTCGSAGCTPQPINVSAAGGTVYLELFGTGLRHAVSATVQVGNASLPALYAGAQGQYPGLDQVNVQLPASLAGSGMLNVVVRTADGSTSNVVTIAVQ